MLNPEKHSTVYILEDCVKIASVVNQSLTIEEMARMQAFRSATRQQQYALSRFLLRALLARHYQPELAAREISSSAINIDADPQGRPLLRSLPLQCSISHSGPLVAVACSGNAIGIDVEWHRQRNWARLVEHYFHPLEQAQFEALDGSSRQAWFYRLWTFKEAVAKARQIGIGRELSQHTQIDLQQQRSFYQSGKFSLHCISDTAYPARLFSIEGIDSNGELIATKRAWQQAETSSQA